jgi:hypothetical protein
LDRACLTRPPAPPGFLNLVTRSSAPSLAALFRAASAHGVAPFRALLLPCSRAPSPAPLPSCRQDEPDGRPTRPTEVGGEPLGPAAGAGGSRANGTAPGASPPSGSCSARESATRCRVLRRAPSAWLSWALCPPGCSPSAGTARTSPCLPSWASLGRTHAAGLAALQGIDSSEVGLSLSRLPTLLGFGAS